ncbi:fungal-specific transcription factor domain-domain-containing protein [Syncephalastrum racemosum]|uniref:Fungal-specific transcription factor domain-domain-containing protein n=1 Tax=Syncephalastrum racemosum TaxID=13706 RepID=A0A1X2HI86_SYNRA|nr:fungal-specific transcription factor domain-domain-containing protein [Syncephalastrum racemosum]
MNDPNQRDPYPGGYTTSGADRPHLSHSQQQQRQQQQQPQHVHPPPSAVEPVPPMLSMNTPGSGPASSSAFWRNALYPTSTSGNTNSSGSNNNNNYPPPPPLRAQPAPTNAAKNDMTTSSPTSTYNPSAFSPMARQDLSEPGEPSARRTSNTSAASAAASNRRTRITRACDTCRRKKIKCDVDSVFPCTTCRQYDWECTFNDTAKKRGPPKGYIESLETRLKKMEKLLETIQSDKNEEPDATQGQKRKRDADEGTDESVSPTILQPLSEPPRSAEYEQPAAKRASPDTIDKDMANEQKDSVVRYLGSSSGYYLMRDFLDDNGATAKSDPTATIPKGLKNITFKAPDGEVKLRTMNVDDDDLVLVRDMTAKENESMLRGRLQAKEDPVPRKVIEVLVRSYFDIPASTLPIIRKDQFMDAFDGRTSPPPPSLLVYAMCTYSCFLLPSNSPLFKDLGVERDDVFHELSDRAAEMIRAEYLVPRISTIQALVILCSHPTYSSSSYRNWILAGMAVRMAQDLGLHRSLTSTQGSKDSTEARKRLWYSVYVTDRWCCAVMGRPLAIADSDCDVDLPDPAGAHADEDYTIFVNFAKLSGILGEVLRRVYSPKAKAAGYKSAAMEQTVNKLQSMLTEWFQQLPDDCRITPEDIHMLRTDPHRYANTKKLTQGGALTICYHSVTLLLHRPFIIAEGADADKYAESSQRCINAATLIIDIARVTPTMSIARFGWNSSAYSVFQAALIHVYNCTSSNPQLAASAREYVRISKDECLTALNRDIPYGPPVVPFLEKLIGLLRADPINKETATTAGGDGGDKSGEASPTANPAAPASVQQQTLQPQAQAAKPQTGNQQQRQYSPMSMQQIVSDFEQPKAPAASAASANEPWMYPSGITSQASSVDNGAEPQALSQATWQQLFSSAGAPFTDDTSGFEAQEAWANFLFGNGPTFSMP